MPTFIGEKITVDIAGEVREPTGFHWRGREHRIAAVLVNWFDWGFAAGSTQRNWRTRRHRNYFRIRTESGDIFEIYLDRATPHGAGEWYLFQQLDPDEAAKPPDEKPDRTDHTGEDR